MIPQQCWPQAGGRAARRRGRFFSPPWSGKRRWNGPLAHVRSPRDNWPYRASLARRNRSEIARPVCLTGSSSGATAGRNGPKRRIHSRDRAPGPSETRAAAWSAATPVANPTVRRSGICDSARPGSQIWDGPSLSLQGQATSLPSTYGPTLSTLLHGPLPLGEFTRSSLSIGSKGNPRLDASRSRPEGYHLTTDRYKVSPFVS